MVIVKIYESGHKSHIQLIDARRFWFIFCVSGLSAFESNREGVGNEKDNLKSRKTLQSDDAVPSVPGTTSPGKTASTP